MSDADQVASILGDWYAGQDEGIVTPPEEVIERHPRLAAQLRARFEALGLLECHFSASEESAAHPHPRIPGYEIVREVGRGAMGLVYEAQQASLGRRVALKVLSPAVTVSPKAVKRFRREAKAAARLHHTNIVPIYGMGREGSHWFYAMELVNGPPLSQVVTWMRAMSKSREESDAAVSDAQARDSGDASAAVSALTSESGSETHKWYVRIADMFAGVADALQLAHENGIVHRDVKPSNLMLSPEPAGVLPPTPVPPGHSQPAPCSAAARSGRSVLGVAWSTLHASGAGGLYSRLLCGRTRLYSCRQRSINTSASRSV